VLVTVVVVVAGVISVGHDDEDVYDDEDVPEDDHGNDHDHHPPVFLGASVWRGKVSPCAAFRDVAALVAGSGKPASVWQTALPGSELRDCERKT